MMGASAVVATTIPQAVGYALAVKTRREDRVVVCFFGDGALEEGVFHESMNFAVLRKLPILFVCENNLYAIHAPLPTRQGGVRIVDRARSYGIPAGRVDDGDPFVTYALALEAVHEIRGGGGPRFLEVVAYRWREHVGPGEDFHAGYRDRAEAAEWVARDPVRRAAEHVPEDVRARIDAEIGAEIAAAFAFAEASPFPPDEALYEHVYGAPMDGGSR
jgi:pyruvate dehydrogenase E1 component alpha subunit